MRCSLASGSPRELGRGSPSPSTSRCSTTGSGCTPLSAIAPPPKHLPTTSSYLQQLDQQPEDLSGIVDTLHARGRRPTTRARWPTPREPIPPPAEPAPAA